LAEKFAIPSSAQARHSVTMITRKATTAAASDAAVIAAGAVDD
jgi:hypothetical protein